MLFFHAAQNAADPSLKLLRTEGFDHIVVRPELQARDPVSDIAESCEHHDRNIRLLAQFLTDPVAIELRHHHVEHDQIRVAFLEAFQGLGSVAGRDDVVPDHREPGFEDPADTGLVIHYEDGFLRGGGC